MEYSSEQKQLLLQFINFKTDLIQQNIMPHPVRICQENVSRTASRNQAASPSADDEEGHSDEIQISKELFLLVIQAAL